MSKKWSKLIVLISTADSVPDRQARTTLRAGARSFRPRARLAFPRDVQAGIRTIIGGRVGAYGELLEQSRDEAIKQMVSKARRLGGNGALATRLSTSQVMGAAAEVVAYGTAVVIDGE